MNISKIFSTVDLMFQNKEIEKVGPYLADCLDKAEQEFDLASVIAICNELGGFYRSLGRHDEAYLLYEKAFNAISSLGLENTEHHATTLINCGTNFAVAGEPLRALFFMEKASEIFADSKIHDDYRVAALHNNMSILYQDLNQPKEALEHLEAALAILKHMHGSEVEIASTYTNMAQIFLQEGNIELASEAALKALDMFKACNSTEDVHYSVALETFGHILFRQELYINALKYFNEAKDLTERDYGKGSLQYDTIIGMVNECSQMILKGDAYNETP